MTNLTILKNLSMVATGAMLINFGIGGTVQAAVINFDTDANSNPINTPPAFIDTTPLTDLYAPLGVTFSGSGRLSGGAILNQRGNFGINARSGSNFLAFNRQIDYLDGGLATDPEIIKFDSPLRKFSIFASGGFESTTFQLEAFDNNDAIIGTTNITTAIGQWGQLNFSSGLGNISKIILTEIGNDDAFVYDDLSFTSASTSVPEPSTVFSTGLVLGLGGLLRKSKKQKLNR